MSIPEVDYTKLKWTLTDPDRFQYGRKVSDGVYQFKEADKADTIVLANYSDDYKEEVAETYYKDLNDLKQIYGEDWEFILAECIFEQTSGLY